MVKSNRNEPGERGRGDCIIPAGSGKLKGPSEVFLGTRDIPDVVEIIHDGDMSGYFFEDQHCPRLSRKWVHLHDVVPIPKSLVDFPLLKECSAAQVESLRIVSPTRKYLIEICYRLVQSSLSP